jgi:hypothetical protein
MTLFPLAAACAAVLAALTTLSLGAARDDEPKPPKPVNLGCNTKVDEDDPFISSEGAALYYASNAKKKYDLLVSRKNSGGKWAEGKPVGGYIQTDVDDRSVFLSPDGKYPQFIWYASKTDKDSNNFDLYVAVRQGANKEFSSPVAMNTIDTPADEMHPWLTKDLKTLYFSRKTKEGWRVFYVTRKEATGAQGFGDPVLVDDLPADFHHATLTPDGKTIYLQGPLDKGRWGLFTSTQTDKGWSKPEALDMLNDASGPIGDKSPCLSRDGQTLYFASDRDGGKGGMDLWAVPVVELKKK